MPGIITTTFQVVKVLMYKMFSKAMIHPASSIQGTEEVTLGRTYYVYLPKSSRYTLPKELSGGYQAPRMLVTEKLIIKYNHIYQYYVYYDPESDYYLPLYMIITHSVEY